jgi:hypothetical protein
MRLVPRLASAVLVTIVGLSVACGSGRNVDGASHSSAQQVQQLPPGRGYMPLATAKGSRAAASVAAATPGTLQYFGGKVISSATVYNIYWGNAGSYQPQLDQFMQTILPSPYFQWLGGDYATPTQTPGAGSFVQSLVDTDVSAGGVVDDTAIRAELVRLVSSGTLPPPDGNNLYFFFFPNGTNVTSTDGGGQSCTTFCGYHDTFVSGSQEFYYGVLPDPATCGSSCDNQGGNYFADLTSVTTHELTESITDAEVGLAIVASEQDGGTYPTYPNAWTSASGEIGDLCAWQNATVDGYNVQLEWSNSANGCVSGGGTTGNDAGTEDTGTTGGDDGGGEGGTCGSCTSDLDCQDNCPPVQGGGTNCCDLGSGICYASSQPSCPVPADAGTE